MPSQFKWYRVGIRIEDVHTLKKHVVSKIKKVLEDTWFDEGLSIADEINGEGKKSVIEGCYELPLYNSEKLFAKLIADNVWKIAGRFIPIRIELIDLEPRPYIFNKNKYALYQKESE